MRHLLIPILFLSFLGSGGGSIYHDPKIEEFINQTGQYVQISDFEKLPEIVRPYQEEMIDYLNKMEMDPQDCYIELDYIVSDTYSLQIPIRHYTGFVNEYNFELEKTEIENNRYTTDQEHQIMIHKGNWSGKDGYFLIEVCMGTITTYCLIR